MRVFVALACLLANCLAQKPQPCDWPPKMTGEATMDFTNDDTGVDIRFVYDAVGQRMRFFQNATRDNETINTDSLLLFKEEVAYNINDQNRTCTKFPLKVDFIPLGVPKNASLLGQVILGSSSGPGEGLMVNTWSVNLPDGGDIISTVTAVGCIPVSLVQKVKIDEQVMGWMVQSFFNNVIGIPDPSLLSPPSFCKDAKVMSNKEPVDFFSLFLHKNPAQNELFLCLWLQMLMSCLTPPLTTPLFVALLILLSAEAGRSYGPTKPGGVANSPHGIMKGKI